MADDDFIPPDEEEIPENLQKKWDHEDYVEEIEGKAFMKCPACGKLTDVNQLTCIYCGEVTQHNSGMLGKMAGWLKTGPGIFVAAATAVGLFILFNLF